MTRPLAEVDGAVLYVMAGAGCDAASRQDEATTGLVDLQAAALSSAANAVIVTEVDGTIVWVNAAFTAMSGYSAAEAIGRTPRLLKSGVQSEEHYARLWETIRAGRAWRGEVVERHADGHLYSVVQAITPIFDPAGEITHFVAIHESLSELRSSQAIMQAIFDHARDAILMVDDDGVVVEANPAVHALTGHPSAALVGRPLAEIVPGGDRASVLAWWMKLLSVGEARGELSVVRADGIRARVEYQAVTNILRGVHLVTARDVTDHWRLESHLLEAQEVAGVGGWAVDLVSGEMEWSAQTCRILGISASQKPDLELFLSRVHPADRDMVVTAWEAGVASRWYRLDHRLLIDGRVVWVRIQGRFELDDAGREIRAVGTVLDITQSKIYEQLLEAEQARLRDAFEAARAASWERHLPVDRFHLDDRWERLLGIAGDEPLGILSGEEWLERVHPEDRTAVVDAWDEVLSGACERYEAEYRMQNQGGGWVWFRDLGRVMEHSLTGAPVLVQGLVLDISEQKAQQERFDFVADHDGLTGLWNRQRFARQLRELLPEHDAPEAGLALICLDLDGFEAINLVHGRAIGDGVLVAVADRLVGWTGDRSLVARIGGDEFAAIVTDVHGPDDPRLAERVRALIDAVSGLLHVEGSELAVTASIGATVFPQPQEVDAEQLLRQADQAAYQAKVSGKNRWELFDLALNEASRERYALLAELRSALHDDGFVLHYQPQVDLGTGDLVGFEALIRWQHPARGLLPPSAFVPFLDRDPLAVEVGDWVVDAVLAQLASWSAQGLTTTVCVNVDQMQIADPDLLPRLEAKVAGYPMLDPSQLTLEILETGALEDLESASALVRLMQAAGFVVALDDFGTGYSSLTFLKQLGAQVVKIDRSFVIGLLDDAEHALIVETIVGLAHNLGRVVVAEGVETAAHATRLLELGCTLGQGFGIARPMPAEEVIPWAARHRAATGWG